MRWVALILACCSSCRGPAPAPPANPTVPSEEASTGDGAGSVAPPPPPPASTPPIDAGADAPAATAGAPDPTGVVAAYCLYAGTEERVVQCYWRREDCDKQIAFNKDLGSTRPQECRPSSVVFCLTPSASSETCFPTAAGCADMHGKLVARNRPTSECVEKRGPAT